MVRELACRKCKCVTVTKICGNCKSTDLSPDWSSSVLVVDPENSVVAKSLGIKAKGKFALKVT
jgi:DNA-directed RNA polymerase subunit E"